MAVSYTHLDVYKRQVQAAARQYFDKDVWDLNLSECVTLAGITQNPTKFNPIINPDSNRKRRKEVLQHMLDQNYITPVSYTHLIRPGRNLAIIVESAAVNHRQKKMGYNAAEEPVSYTHLAECITGNEVSSNQFVNSILQKERFVTEKFRKI